MPGPLSEAHAFDFDLEVNQHLADVKRCEANGEDHQDGGQQPDGTSPPRPALLGHQAVSGGEKTGDAQGEAHHSKEREEELQDGEVEEGRKEHTGRTQLQGCRLENRGWGDNNISVKVELKFCFT